MQLLAVQAAIFAVNNANITNSKLTNNGTVIGNSGNGTGGIFGVNTGNISTSSLINEVDGQVIGTNNVGGLIGTNTGTITGGVMTLTVITNTRFTTTVLLM